MNLALFKPKPQQRDVVTIVGSLTQEQHLNEWGIEKAPIGLDVSRLLLAMYDTVFEEVRTVPAAKRGWDGIEVCFFDRGHDWIHSQGIDSHAFRIDTEPIGIDARVMTTKSAEEVQESIGVRLQAMVPYTALDVTHGAPTQGLWWNEPQSFHTYGPFQTGFFDVGARDKHPTQHELVMGTGLRVFEMLRHIFRTAAGSSSYSDSTPSISFDQDRTFTIKLHPSWGNPIQIVSGFLTQSDVIRVAYVGIAPGKGHPHCEFDQIAHRVHQYFPDGKK